MRERDERVKEEIRIGRTEKRQREGKNRKRVGEVR
jgi:hypothetical protein